jgi:hypothetical protein
MSIEALLSTNGLVKEAPTAKSILARADYLAPSPIRLFYGETYDDKGHTIDSLKYYLFVSNLAETLQKAGRLTDSTILIADTAACRNVGPENQNYYMVLGEERANFVKKVNKVYKTGLRVVKMSEYIHSPDFLGKREKIIEQCKGDPTLMEAIKKTVPESKVEIEREKGFLYSFDEIATIINFDVKVGPPREDLYDNVARSIAKRGGKNQIMSLFLTPSFPVGMNWAYFFANDGIEDHGITAYKAGSKRLQKNRVIIEGSNPTYIRELINNSFISLNRSLPNPVLDIGIICEMARNRLEGNERQITLADDFYEGRVSETELKETVGIGVEKYILSKFQK